VGCDESSRVDVEWNFDIKGPSHISPLQSTHAYNIQFCHKVFSPHLYCNPWTERTGIENSPKHASTKEMRTERTHMNPSCVLAKLINILCRLYDSEREDTEGFNVMT